MKPEDKVTDLKFCKKLVELGGDIDTEKCWVDYEECDVYILQTNRQIVTSAIFDAEYSKSIPAPDTTELLEILPNYVSISNCGGGRHAKRVDYLVCENQNSNDAFISKLKNEIDWKTFRDKKPANALVKMLIYLKENNLLAEDKL